MKRVFILIILTIFCLCMTVGSVSAVQDCSTYEDNHLDFNSDSSSNDEILVSSLDSNYSLSSESNSNLDDVDVLSSDSSSVESNLNSNYTIYFNANATSDGDGTFENPYKEFSFSKLKSNSSAYLFNGVYNLNGAEGLSNLSFINLCGEDTSRVIIESGESSVFSFNNFTISNLTLKGVYINVKFYLNATNVIFRDSVGPKIVNNDSYGGTICSINVQELILSNCSFINNSGNYGGAISCFDNAVNVMIENSKFINNTGIYGGAIYLKSNDDTELDVIIKNSEFINNTAVYGGAIFLDTNVMSNIKYSKFLNNSASAFGGSISVSKGTLNLFVCEFENSCSEAGSGGAVYLIKSNSSLNNVLFNNCSSELGGSICSVNSNINISNSKFYRSNSKYAGGVFYGVYGHIIIDYSIFYNCSSFRGGSIFVDSCDSIKLVNSNFIDNNACYGSDLFSNENPNLINTNNSFINNDTIYNQSEFTLNVFDDDYIVVVNNNSLVYNFSDKYDLRVEGCLTPIKNQFNGEDCWAFASIAAIESAILKANNGSQIYILSEDNVKNLMRVYSYYGWPFDFDGGAIPPMPIAYLACWLGPIYGVNDTYHDLSVLSPSLSPLLHVQNILCADLEENNLASKDSIKYLIVNYGAVSTVYCHDFNETYYNDETYSYYYDGSDDINHAVAIVGWDDDYSKDNFVITPPGDGAWIVRNSWGNSFGDGGYFYVSYYDTRFTYSGSSYLDNYVIVFNDSTNYTRNYQYDLGVSGWIDSGNTTVWYKNTFTSVEDELLSAVSTYFKTKTDYTAYIYLNDVLVLSQNGSVDHEGYYTIQLNNLISIKTGDNFTVMFKINNSHVYFPIFDNNTSLRDYSVAGVSFFSCDGLNWTDLYNYTKSPNDPMVACIKAFTTSTNSLIPLVNLSANDVLCNDDAIVNVSVSSNYTGSMIIIVNNKEYDLNVVDGFATLKLSNLTVGTYNVVAKLNTTLVLSSTSFNVKSSTSISASNLKITAYTTKYLVITLKDVNGNVLKGKKITFTFNGKNYTGTTDSKGQAKLAITSKNVKTYKVTIKFAGEDYYLASSKSVNITIVPAYVTVSDIIKSAKTLKSYSVKNKKLPNTIKVESYKLTHAQLSYLMTVAIKDIKAGKKLSTKVKVLNIKYTKYNAKVSKKIMKKSYLKVINSLYKKGVKGKLPKYFSYDGKKIGYNPYTYSMAKILAFYSSNKKLPKYCIFENY